MKSVKLVLPLLATIGCIPAQAALAPLLDPYLNGLSLFASSYVVTGAGAKIYGNFLSGAALTSGAQSLITGNVQAVGAATTGAGSVINGSFQAGAALDLGADSKINGLVYTGAAATFGANARVGGNLVAGAAYTQGAGSMVLGAANSGTPPPPADIPTAATMSPLNVEVANAQKGLNNLGAQVTLAVSMAGSNSLKAGAYSTSALDMAAGTFLTLDGQNLANQLWVFNVAGTLNIGANTKIRLINGGADSSVIWNTGGITNLDADSEVLGTVFSKDHATLGAGASVTGTDNTCGGVFSSSYVTLGADARVGSAGCSGANNAYWYAVNTIDLNDQPTTLLPNRGVAPVDSAPSTEPSQVPEPATLGLVFAGLAGMAVTSRRRRSA